MVRNVVGVLALSAWGLLASAASAQDWAEKMFPQQEYDFGSVARGALAEHKFPVKNLYKEDVHLSSVTSSCGCTAPRLSQDLLKSMQQGYIIADFNTRAFDGDHGATLTVTIDQPFPAQVQLKVKGFIRKDVVLNPGRVDLGNVDAGDLVERKVEVAYAGRSDWEIVDVRSANPNFEVEMNQKERSAGRVSYELTVRLKPSAPPGFISDRLTLVTNDANNRLISLPVEGNVVAVMTVSPASLQMGMVKSGATSKRQLVVKGKSPFKIVRIDCDDKAFKFETTDEARKLHVIPVTYTGGDKAGKFTRQIRIVTDAGISALPAVTAHVEVQAEPAASPIAPPAAKTELTPGADAAKPAGSTRPPVEERPSAVRAPVAPLPVIGGPIEAPR